MRHAFFWPCWPPRPPPPWPSSGRRRRRDRTSSSPASASRIIGTGSPPAWRAIARPTRISTPPWRWPRRCSSTGEYRDARNGDPRLARPQPRRGPQLSRAGLRPLPRQCPRRPPSRPRPRRAQFSTRDILRALQAGLPVEDHRHFTARLEIAQIADRVRPISTRRPARAARLAERARAAGRDDVVAIAELRGLWYCRYLQAPGGTRAARADRAVAHRPIRASVDRRQDPARPNLRRTRATARAPTRCIAELGTEPAQRRQLLFSAALPAADQQDVDPTADEVARQRRIDGQPRSQPRSPGTIEDKWIDVGFWIQPDGQRVGPGDRPQRRRARSGPSRCSSSIRGRRYSQATGPKRPTGSNATPIRRAMEMRGGQPHHAALAAGPGRIFRPHRRRAGRAAAASHAGKRRG